MAIFYTFEGRSRSRAPKTILKNIEGKEKHSESEKPIDSKALEVQSKEESEIPNGVKLYTNNIKKKDKLPVLKCIDNFHPSTDENTNKTIKKTLDLQYSSPPLEKTDIILDESSESSIQLIEESTVPSTFNIHSLDQQSKVHSNFQQESRFSPLPLDKRLKEKDKDIICSDIVNKQENNSLLKNLSSDLVCDKNRLLELSISASTDKAQKNEEVKEKQEAKEKFKSHTSSEHDTNLIGDNQILRNQSSNQNSKTLTDLRNRLVILFEIKL
jgi:hypothetical protein